MRLLLHQYSRRALKGEFPPGFPYYISRERALMELEALTGAGLGEDVERWLQWLRDHRKDFVAQCDPRRLQALPPRETPVSRHRPPP